MRAARWILVGIVGGALLAYPAVEGLALLLRGVDDPHSRWVDETLGRKRGIAARTTAPQILLVGGSNVNYGYSAALLEREAGIPSTNLAVHAGLGRRFLFWDALRLAKPGDLVVFAMEYRLYGEPFHDPAERDQALLHDRDYFEQLPWTERWRLLGTLGPGDWLRFLRLRIQGPAAGTDDFMVLDERGDQTDNLREGVPIQPAPGPVESLDPDFAGELAQFAATLRRLEADVVIAFPNLREAEFRRRVTPEFIAAVRRAAQSAAVTVVGAPEDGAFPDALAYDTDYHLNARGTVIATRRLMRQLREAGVALPGSTEPSPLRLPEPSDADGSRA